MIARSSKFTLIRMLPLETQGSWKENSTLEEDKTLGVCYYMWLCPPQKLQEVIMVILFSDLVNFEQGSVLSSLYSS